MPPPATQPSGRRMEEIIELVSRHRSGPILVERMVNAAVKRVREHWRKRHNPGAPYRDAGAGAGVLPSSSCFFFRSSFTS